MKNVNHASPSPYTHPLQAHLPPPPRHYLATTHQPPTHAGVCPGVRACERFEGYNYVSPINYVDVDFQCKELRAVL